MAKEIHIDLNEPNMPAILSLRAEVDFPIFKSTLEAHWYDQFNNTENIALPKIISRPIFTFHKIDFQAPEISQACVFIFTSQKSIDPVADILKNLPIEILSNSIFAVVSQKIADKISTLLGVKNLNFLIENRATKLASRLNALQYAMPHIYFAAKNQAFNFKENLRVVQYQEIICYEMRENSLPILPQAKYIVPIFSKRMAMLAESYLNPQNLGLHSIAFSDDIAETLNQQTIWQKVDFCEEASMENMVKNIIVAYKNR